MTDKSPAKVNPSREFNALANKLAIETDMVETDGASLDEFVKGRLVAIDQADDFASVNAAMESVSLPASKDLVGRTFAILDFALRQSTKEGGRLKKYAIIKSVDENGEEFIFEGGGDNFVIGLTRMRDLYDFPFTGTITGRPTDNGVLIAWRFMDPKRPKIQ
jgi:hypothetical protein